MITYNITVGNGHPSPIMLVLPTVLYKEYYIISFHILSYNIPFFDGILLGPFAMFKLFPFNKLSLFQFSVYLKIP